MKKLQYILLVLVLVLASCNNKDSIWNVMGDMDSRVSTLETLCQEMNTNIAALETLIKAQNNGDYITNITEIRNGNAIVGYTITFKNSDPITIYNGTNGKDGRDGVDGYKPTVGAKQDTDGVYYWTVDGNWLTDANGNKIRVTGDKGQDGKDGNDGTNGVNGNTPQLKIENNYWYISYDGPNWTQLGKATGENGKDGKDGQDGTNGDKGDKGDKGDSMFSSVTQDDNYVYFTLADGTIIKIAKNGNGSGTGGTHADEDIIEFKDLNVKFALLHHTPEIDTNHDGEISYAEAKAVKRIIIENNTDIVSFKELQYFENLTSVYFGGCSKLFEVCLPTGLDSIPKNGFSYCSSLINIELPNSVTYIGQNFLQRCTNLQSITFPESYTDGEYPPYQYDRNYQNTFENLQTMEWNSIDCSVDFITNAKPYSYGLSVCYDSNNPSGYPTSMAPNISEIHFGDKVIRIPSYLCYGMTKLRDVVIPQSVIYIGDYSFFACSELTNVSIPDNVEVIGPYAFGRCTKLRELTIGGKVANIGANAFYNCNSLTNVTISDNVEVIGTKAFGQCTKLTEITIGKKVASIESVFYGCLALKKIYCKAQQPPIIDDKSIPSSISVIYVPRESVNDYRATWSNYANKILGYDFE